MNLDVEAFMMLCASNSPHPRVSPSNGKCKGDKHAHMQLQQSLENMPGASEMPAASGAAGADVHRAVSINRAISNGRSASRRCSCSYRSRSPTPQASASTIAWLNARHRPSPVIASTVPEASPINATLPRLTRFKLACGGQRAFFGDAPPLPSSLRLAIPEIASTLLSAATSDRAKSAQRRPDPWKPG